MSNYNFDATKIKLGELCRRGHDWEGTGKSLRLLSNKQCCQCRKDYHVGNKEAIYSRAREKQERETEEQRAKRLEYHRSYHQSNREKHLQDFCNYRKLNIEQSIQKDKNYYCSNRERILQQKKEYQKTSRYKELRKRYRLANIEKYSLRDKARRALKKNAPLVSKLSSLEMSNRYAEFQNCCAYCGSIADSIDHFFPLAKGGSHILSNLVPACKSCNSSKQDTDPQGWYEQRRFYSKTRWRKILKVLGKQKGLGQLSLF